MRRLLLMFSVATLGLASPVYLRMAENPGLASVLWLSVQLQILPTLALLGIDLWLERASPGVWRGWRALLCAACLLATARQAQASFNVPSPSGTWANLTVGVAAVAGAVLLAVLARPLLTRILAAAAPALVIWTAIMAYTLVPPPAGAAQTARPPRPVAVFVLIFDELDRDVIMRNGRVGAEWPSFARLAARGRVFADATANYGYTCGSVGSLLTARLFDAAPAANRHCLQGLPWFRGENLLTLLAERFTVRLYAQYLTYCFDATFQCRGTAYVQARAPYLSLLEHYVPDEVRAATGTERLLGPSLHTYTVPVFDQFLADLDASARGTVSWVHVLMPHAPYVYDAAGTRHPRDYRESWRTDPAEYRLALAAYRRQIGFTDRLLGRFLDRLEAAGLAEDAIVVVTSDHGFYSLDPFAAPRLIDGFETSASRPRVPVIVRAPKVAPGVVAAPYQHLDFKAMLLGLIDGVDRPETTVVDRPKIFCDSVAWRERDAAGRWSTQPGPDGRPRACGGP